jgi:hypothetical protein
MAGSYHPQKSTIETHPSTAVRSAKINEVHQEAMDNHPWISQVMRRRTYVNRFVGACRCADEEANDGKRANSGEGVDPA